MRSSSQPQTADRLTKSERFIAATVAAALLGIALALLVWPPPHQVALEQCRDASAGCIVSVDSDLSTFAAALAAAGALVALVGILGIRFNKFKVPGGELSRDYADQTEGYAPAPLGKDLVGLPVTPPAGEEADQEGPEAPQTDTERPWTDPESHGQIPVEASGPRATADRSPIIVRIEQGLGESLKAPAPVPIAITSLRQPIREVDPAFLRDYQAGRRVSQHGFFLTHILGPAKSRGQLYSVAIRVSPHKDRDPWLVKSASFYLGRSWGSRVFEGQRGVDGRFGITTEAYGPFLALCEVEFDDGRRILLDHYCDFDMGSLLPT
jgi:hypothetical protein